MTIRANRLKFPTSPPPSHDYNHSKRPYTKRIEAVDASRRNGFITGVEVVHSQFPLGCVGHNVASSLLPETAETAKG